MIFVQEDSHRSPNRLLFYRKQARSEFHDQNVNYLMTSAMKRKQNKRLWNRVGTPTWSSLYPEQQQSSFASSLLSFRTNTPAPTSHTQPSAISSLERSGSLEGFFHYFTACIQKDGKRIKIQTLSSSCWQAPATSRPND